MLYPKENMQLPRPRLVIINDGFKVQQFSFDHSRLIILNGIVKTARLNILDITLYIRLTILDLFLIRDYRKARASLLFCDWNRDLSFFGDSAYVTPYVITFRYYRQTGKYISSLSDLKPYTFSIYLPRALRLARKLVVASEIIS